MGSGLFPRASLRLMVVQYRLVPSYNYVESVLNA